MNQDNTSEGNTATATQPTAGRGQPRAGRPDDVSAISTAFIEHSSLLKRFLTRFFYQPQDIEDVVQEVYIRAYNAEQAEVVIEQPKAFLFRVARNLALNELRRKSRYIAESIEAAEPGHYPGHHLETPSLEDELEARQHLGLYCEAIASLPEQCRRVCLLRKVHGLKQKEIAERLDLSLSSVEKHLRRGALACDAYIMEREEGGTVSAGLAPARQATAGQAPPAQPPTPLSENRTRAGRKAPTHREVD